jgi:hypothetical protein
VTSNRASLPWAAKLWFAASAVSAMDAVTSLTGWMNFAHHDRAHAFLALSMAGAWAVLGVYFMRRQPAH